MRFNDPVHWLEGDCLSQDRRIDLSSIAARYRRLPPNARDTSATSLRHSAAAMAKKVTHSCAGPQRPASAL